MITLILVIALALVFDLINGFDGAANSIATTTGMLGIPVSTTHTITGAIIGAGAVRRISAVRWGLTGNILIAWVITIPVTSLLAAILYELISIIL